MSYFVKETGGLKFFFFFFFKFLFKILDKFVLNTFFYLFVKHTHTHTYIYGLF